MKLKNKMKKNVSIIIWIVVITIVVVCFFLNHVSSERISMARRILDIIVDDLDVIVFSVKIGAITPEEGFDELDEEEKQIDEIEQIVISAKRLNPFKSTKFIEMRIENARRSIEISRDEIAIEQVIREG